MKVFIHDEFDPEVEAMLQAFYSRSATSIEQRVSELGDSNDKIKAALKRYYIGYGHSSIGECGETVLFFEDVSMLAAKAIQNFTLYQGQECSSRYIDFQNRKCINPIKAISHIQQGWMDLYCKMQPQVLALLRELYVPDQSVSAEQHDRTLVAKSFDICRCFLPIGVTTQLSWKTDLRKARERLMLLKWHPCSEVSALAQSALNMLIVKYPSSFKEDDATVMHDMFDTFYSDYVSALHFDIPSKSQTGGFEAAFVKGDCGLSTQTIMSFLNRRPERVDVPQHFDRLGGFRFNFRMDYGSWRDLARHRSARIPMPLVGAEGRFTEFEPWYLNQIHDLSPELGRQAAAAINHLFNDLSKERELNKYELQYYYPLGTLVDVNMYASLPSAIYVAELRSGISVHPTVRAAILKMISIIREFFPTIKLYVDETPVDEVGLNLARGNQTILEKK